jgi:hypothetical protein
MVDIWCPCPESNQNSIQPSEAGEEMDARQKRPIKHEYGGTTVLTEGTEALERAESLVKEDPDGWVYIHVEYRGDQE